MTETRIILQQLKEYERTHRVKNKTKTRLLRDVLVWANSKGYEALEAFCKRELADINRKFRSREQG